MSEFALLSSNSLGDEYATQLPVSWYFDTRVFDLELNRLFKPGSDYIGHASLVPNIGDYYALSGRGNDRILMHHQTGIELVSNICRHRQAVMLTGKGNTKKIVCPLHRWTYSCEGKLIGSPQFPQNPHLDLETTRLQRWNGLLFDGQRDVTQDLATLGVSREFDFTDYVLEFSEVTDYPINWKTFIEVYLDDYHVAPFHPGLGNFVTCDDLTWEFGEWYSVQTVGVKNRLVKSGSLTYERWHNAVRKYYTDRVLPYGSIWMLYYPNIMLEWYPQTLVVSILIPRSPELTTNVVDFYYPKDIAWHDREFIEAERDAYMETAVEDDEIARRMTEGRRALYQANRNAVGPYQSPMEDGMKHFHEFLRRNLEPHL
jgi:phenylpropionate dioxygenase-like ring-hydroxylating dioxygenase large terminal subunit